MKLPAIRPIAGVGALVIAALVLGPPRRPVVTVDAVTAGTMTQFAATGLQLTLTIGVWYLLAATVAHGLSRLPRVGRLVRPLADRMVTTGLAVVLRRVIATSVVAGVSLPGGVGAEDGGDAADVPVMVPIDPVTDEPIGGTARPSSPTPTTRPTTHATDLMPDDDAAPSMVRRMDPPPAETATRPAPTPPTPPTDPRGTHTVRSGESFWSIADDLERSRAEGEEPALDAIVATWQILIDANADRLVDPGNPDLLHVGQVIDLS
jgi:hypothetical protein